MKMTHLVFLFCFFTVSSLQELFGSHLTRLRFSVSATQNLKLMSTKQLPNSSRSEETIKSKTKTQGK